MSSASGASAQVDNAYLDGEQNGGKTGRGSENKNPFVTAIPVVWSAITGQAHLWPSLKAIRQ